MKRRVLILSLVLAAVVIALAILADNEKIVQGQKRVIEIEVAQDMIQKANQLTGLNELENVQITAEPIELKENEDNSPIRAIHSRIVGRLFWRVTYTGEFPEWNGQTNPNIRAFVVFLDAQDGSLLKVASKWAEDIDKRYKVGAWISREKIATLISDNHAVSNTLPKVPPLRDTITRLTTGTAAYIDAKHIEWYYLNLTREEGDVPAWLRITHGGPVPIYLGPHRELGPELKNEVTPDYQRVARISLKDARTGKSLLSAEMVGTN